MIRPFSLAVAAASDAIRRAVHGDARAGRIGRHDAWRGCACRGDRASGELPWRSPVMGFRASDHGERDVGSVVRNADRGAMLRKMGHGRGDLVSTGGCV